MKTLVTLILALGLPLVVQATPQEIKTTTTTVNRHSVTVRTETTAQAPAVCRQAFDRMVDQQGRHDLIYRWQSGSQGFVIVSQRESDRCMLNAAALVPDVKITMWKAAVAKDGKTVTEMRTIRLSPTEVNTFLDYELPQVAADFVSAPLGS